MTATGTINRMDQKSGWRAKRTMIMAKSDMYGMKPHPSVAISDLFRFKKYEKYKTAPSFTNSTGCREKGKKGTLIHHLAPL